MRALTLPLCLVLVLSACSGSSPAPTATPSTPPPPPPPNALTGVVLDFYTRKPFPKALLDLSAYSGCSVSLQATTDEQGRFRFEGLSKCTRDQLLFLRGRDCADCMLQDPLTVDHKEVEVLAGRGDLGQILLAHDAAATASFGGVCKGAAPRKDQFGAGPQLVMLGWEEKTKAWEGDFYIYNKFMKEPLLPWPAVLCVRTTFTVVGQYGDSGSKGHAVSTRATLVRAGDGRRFSTSLRGEPPARAETSSGDHYGNTDEPLLAWLKTLAASNPS